MTDTEEKWLTIATNRTTKLREARILLGRCLSLIGDQYTDEVLLRQGIKKFLIDTKPDALEREADA